MIVRTPGEIQGRSSDVETAAAWAVFDKNALIHSQYNVSSVTDNGTGDWTVNWRLAFANTTYAVVGCTRDTTSGSLGSVLGILTGDNLTTTWVRVRTGNSLGAAKDPTDGIYILAVGRR